MLKFNEQQQIDNIQGALELRPEVEKIMDGVWKKDLIIFTTWYLCFSYAGCYLH